LGWLEEVDGIARVAVETERWQATDAGWQVAEVEAMELIPEEPVYMG
jgi:hypothetical protein